MQFKKLNLLAIILVIISAKTLFATIDKQNYAPIKIGGSVDVSPSGAATYQIPIEICPGSHNMQPNLSIVFNSQSGNGLLGWGWNIGGLSAISRTNKVKYYDNTFEAIRLNSSDPLMLDGVRLVKVDNNTYYPTNNPYTTIKFVNNSFTATTQDGVVMEFGINASSRIIPQGKTEVITWVISKITDSEGNYISFNYEINSQTGETYIKEINYTGNSKTSKTPYNKVEFNYTQQPDPHTSYVAGGKLTQNALLTSIKVYNEGNLSIEYTFGYTYDFYNRLSTINLTANGVKHLPTTINWGQTNISQRTISSAGIGTLQSGQSYFGDFNGDGLIDRTLFNGNNYLLVYINGVASDIGIDLPQNETDYNSNGYTQKSYIVKDINVVDWNNDGKDDILVHYTYSIYITDNRNQASEDSYTEYDYVECFSLNQSTFSSTNLSTFVTQPTTTMDRSNPADYNFYYADLNNDGTVEQIVVKNKRLVGCNGLNIGSVSGIDYFDELRFLDFNGNGRIDLMFIRYNGNGYIWEFNGTNLVNIHGSISSTNYTYNFKHFFPGDFNGDGKTDYIGRTISNGWFVKYSNGVDFISGTLPESINLIEVATPSLSNDYPQIVNQPSELFEIQKRLIPALAMSTDDINNDGKSDIIYARRNNLYVYLSKGNNFYFADSIVMSNINYPRDSNAPILIFSMDMNYDGQKEIIYGSNNYYLSNYIAHFEPFRKVEFASPLDKSFTVLSIDDGMENSFKFNYSAFTDNRFYSTTLPKPTFPLMLLRGPMRYVSNLTITNGEQTLSSNNYNFADGYFHLGGLGFLGFKTVKTTSLTDNSTSISTYDYNIDGAGGVLSPWLKKQITSKAGIPIAEVTNTMAVCKLNTSAKSMVPYLKTSTSTDKLTDVTTTTVTTFDSIIGRTVEQVVSAGGWSTKTQTNYQVVNGNITRPISISITKSKGTETFTASTTLSYDSNNPLRLLSRTEQGITATYSNFDAYGNPQRITTTAAGVSRSVSSTYDNKGRFVLSTTDIIGNTTTYNYRSSDGFKLSEQTAIGITTYTPTVQGGKLLTQIAYPNGTTATDEFGWNTADNGYYNKQSVQYGGTQTSYFNSLGQKVKQTVTGFLDAELTTEYTYNALGQLVQEKHPGVDTPTSYTYDNLGRTLAVTGANNLSVSYAYSGNSITTTSSVTGTETKTYDALGNITQVVSPNGTVTYEYYASGKVKKINAEGAETVMTYDPITLQQLTLADPDAGTTSYQYNAFGELIAQTDAKGQTITCEYKPTTGQLLSKAANGLTETYTYYEDGIQRGLLKTTTRNGITETYTYDNLARLVAKTLTGANKTFTTQYQYNSTQQLETVTYPTGLTLKYVYDNSGNTREILRVNNQTNSTTLVWRGLPKNERNQWTTFELGNGLKTQWTYDSNFMLSAINTGTTSNPSMVQSLTFTFNSKGQLTQRTDGQNLSEGFNYDELNRLTASWIAGADSVFYNYHSNGNISSTSITGEYEYGVGGKPHAVSSVQTTSGNNSALPMLTTSSTFTADNMVATMDNGTYRNVFTYGPSGNRFRVEHYQQQAFVLAKFYDANSEFITDSTGSIVISRTIINAPSGTCAVYQDSAGLQTLHYVHTDYLGSWLAITDSTGQVENRYSYDAWGRPRNPETWELLPVALGNALTSLSAMQPRFDRGYTGHEHMCNFGIINMNGRLYDPYLQRFLSPDPYVQAPGNAQSYNRYTYCINNPLMYTDPSGYTWWSQFTGWVKDNWKPIVAVACAVAVTVATGGYGVAILGGYANMYMNASRCGNFGDFVTSFSVGALSSALAAGASNFMQGIKVFGAIPGFFINGSITGLTGGISAGFGNVLCYEDWKVFGESFLIGFTAGFIIGGTMGAIEGYKNAIKVGANPWTGALYENEITYATALKTGIPLQPDPEKHCYGYSLEYADSGHGNKSADYFLSKVNSAPGADPELVARTSGMPVEQSLTGKVKSATGYDVIGRKLREGKEILGVISKGTQGHAVNLTSITTADKLRIIGGGFKRVLRSTTIWNPIVGHTSGPNSFLKIVTLF